MKMRTGEICSISDIVKSIAPNAKKYETIFLSWHKVVGVELAKISSPHKIKNDGDKKILVIHVNHGYALEVQYDSLKILQQINDFLGEKCFDKINVIQCYKL